LQISSSRNNVLSSFSSFSAGGATVGLLTFVMAGISLSFFFFSLNTTTDTKTSRFSPSAPDGGLGYSTNSFFSDAARACVCVLSSVLPISAKARITIQARLLLQTASE